MTLFARDVDTGMAKWVYQMTPHDEWDYDGVNEMILAELNIGGKERKTLTHFDRNGFGYTLDRVTGELLVAQKYDPAVNWATQVDMATGRPQVVAKYSTHKNGPGRQHARTSARRRSARKDQQPAAYSPEDQALLRADEPRLHGLRAVRGRVRRRPAVRRRHALDVSRPARSRVTARPTSATSSPGTAATGKIVWSIPEPFSVWSGALATAGDVVFYGTLEGYLKAVDCEDGQGAVQVQDPVGHHRQRQHLDAQGQAVRRRAVGCRRLGGHRHGGRARG